MTHAAFAVQRVEDALATAAPTTTWELWLVTDGVARSTDGTMFLHAHLMRRPLPAGVGRIVIVHESPAEPDEP